MSREEQKRAQRPLEHEHERVRRALDDAAKPDPDEPSHQRSVGAAVALLALVVVVLLAAIAGGLVHPFGS
jgi:hypothetical protein